MDIEALKKEIKRSTKPTPERLLELSRLDPQLSRLIPKHVSNIPLTLYHELIKSRDMATRAAVARDPQAPLEVLEILARDPQWTVAKAIFGSKIRRKITVPDSLFETVASHKHHTVRQSVAEHYDCPPQVLERLSCDPAPEVRKAVASKDNATAKMLERMSNDTAPEVRSAVANNENTAAEVLERMSDDPVLGVVLGITQHPKVLDSTLNKLAQHPHPLARRYTVDPLLLGRAVPTKRFYLVAHDSDLDVLEQVLYYPNAPTDLVEQILTRNPELLQRKTEFFISGNHVYGGGGCIPLIFMLEHHPDLSEGLLGRIAVVCNGTVHFHLLKHPKANAEILDRVAQTHLAYLAKVAFEPAKECDPAKQYSDGAERAEYLEYELWFKLKQSSEQTLKHLLEHPSLSPATRSRIEARTSD